MTDYRFLRQQYLRSNQLGMTAKLTSGALTSSTFDVRGCCAMAFMFEFTRVAGTGNITFTVEAQNPETLNWIVLQSVDTAAGVSTLTDNSIVKATASASCSGEFRLRNLCYFNMRLKVAAVTASTTDAITVNAVMSYGEG